jgi:hypothetical protein
MTSPATLSATNTTGSRVRSSAIVSGCTTVSGSATAMSRSSVVHLPSGYYWPFSFHATRVLLRLRILQVSEPSTMAYARHNFPHSGSRTLNVLLYLELASLLDRVFPSWCACTQR